MGFGKLRVAVLSHLGHLDLGSVVSFNCDAVFSLFQLVLSLSNLTLKLLDPVLQQVSLKSVKHAVL